MDGRDLCITRNFSGLDMSTPFGAFPTLYHHAQAKPVGPIAYD